MRKNIKYIFPVFLVLSVLMVLSQCVNPFAPKLTEISNMGDVFLTDQKTPEDVLTNFKYAYTFKDSLIYRDLLDPTFVFIYRDVDSDRFLSWDKEVDIKTTIGLFNAFTNIDLNWLTTNHSSFGLDSTTAEISKSFILSFDSETQILGDALFNFVLDEQSGVWRITRWVDKSIY